MWISKNRSHEPYDLIYGTTPFPGCKPSLFGFISKRIIQSLFVNVFARTHVWVGDGQFTYSSNMSIEHTWPTIFNFFFLIYTSAKNLKNKSYGF